MADEVKAKRPVPPQFLKKKKEKEEQSLKVESDKLPDPPLEIRVQLVDLAEQRERNVVDEIVKDLMFNRYFHIMEKEARPIAESMVKHGSEILHEIKWFLAHSERVQLAKELKEKHGLL